MVNDDPESRFRCSNEADYWKQFVRELISLYTSLPHGCVQFPRKRLNAFFYFQTGREMWKRMLAKICWSRDYVILESTCFSGLRESRHEASAV